LAALPARAASRSPDAAPRYPDAAPRHHTPESLVCTDCHLAGGEQVRPPLGGVPAGAAAAPGGAPNRAFLRYADPLDLCLSCHDDHPGVPDVLGEDVNGLADRSAGAFGPPDVAGGNGHVLVHALAAVGAAGDQAPGPRPAAVWTAGVTCIDCHDPHGSHLARNLRPPESDPGVAALGLFDDPHAVGMARYESRAVTYGTLDGDDLREVSSVCLRCHADLSGAHGLLPGGEGYGRHPCYDSAGGAVNDLAQGAARGITSPAHWAEGRGSGFAGTQRVRVVVRGATDFAGGQVVSGGRNGVFCLTCHKAHGSSQPFGLAWPAARGLTATGCDQCHAVAGEADPAVAGVGSGPALLR
jgi:hypothetical protein